MFVNPGSNFEIANGGLAVLAIPAGVNGGIITNPLFATDQDLVNAEPLIVNPISPAATTAGGSNFALQPGQSWDVPPGQTTPTFANALSSGHRFSVVYW